MPTSRSDFSSAAPLQVGTSPLVEAIETNFASLVSSLKDLDAVRKRSSSSRDGQEKLAAACEQFCTSSKRVMRATIQSVDKMVEEYSSMKHRHPAKSGMPMLVDRLTPMGSRGTDSGRVVSTTPRDMILSQKVIDYWKMYCFGQKVKRAVEKRQTEMLSHLQSAQKLAEGAKAEVSQVEQKEAALKTELLRSQLECQSLMKQVHDLNSTIYRLEMESQKSSGKPDDKMRQVQSDLRLLNEQLQKSDEAAKQVAEELRILRSEHIGDKEESDAQIAQLLEEKQRLEVELSIATRSSRSTSDQKDMEIKSLNSALNDRDRQIASLKLAQSSGSLTDALAERDNRIAELEKEWLETVSEKDKKISQLETENQALSRASAQTSRSGLTRSQTGKVATDEMENENRDLKSTIDRLESEKRSIRKELEQSLDQLESANRNLKTELQNTIDRMESEKRTIRTELQGTITQLEAEKRSMRTELQTVIDQLEFEKRNLVSQREDLAAAVSDRDRRLALLDSTQLGFSAQKEAFAEAIADRERTINQLEVEKRERDLKLAELEAEREQLRIVVEEKDRRIREIESVKAELAGGLTERDHSIARLDTLSAKNEERLRDLASEISERDRRIGKLESDLASLKSVESDLRAKISAKDRKIAAMEDLEESSKSLEEKVEVLTAAIMEKEAVILTLEKEADRARQLASLLQDREVRISQLEEQEEHGKLLAVALEDREMRIAQLEKDQKLLAILENQIRERDAKISELETLEGKTMSLTNSLTERDRRIAQLEDARAEISNLSNQIAIMADKLSDSDKDIKALALELKQADARYDRVKSENTELQKQLVEIRASSSTRIEDLTKQLHKAENEGATNSHKVTQMQLERQRSEVTKDAVNAQLRAEIAALKDELSKLDPVTIKSIQAQNAQLNEEIAELTSRYQSSAGETRVLRMQLSSLKKVLVDAGVVTEKPEVESDSVQTSHHDHVKQTHVQTHRISTHHAGSGPEKSSTAMTEVQTNDIHYDEICEALEQIASEQGVREAAVAASNKRVAALAEEIANLNFQLAEKEVSNGKLTQDMLDLRSKLEASTLTCANLEKSVATISTQLVEREARLSILETESLNRQHMIDDLSGQISPKQAANIALQRSVDDLAIQLSGKTSELVQMQCRLDELKSELASKMAEIEKLGELNQAGKVEIETLKREIARREEVIGEIQNHGFHTVQAYEDRIQFLLSQVTEKEQILGELQLKMGMRLPQPVAQTSLTPFDQMVGKMQSSASHFVSAGNPADSIQIDTLRSQLSASEQSAKELRTANSALLERMIKHANLMESDVVSSQQAALDQAKRELAQSSSIVAAKDLEISKLTAATRLIQQQLAVSHDNVSELENRLKIQNEELETVKEELTEVLRDAKHMQDRYEDRLRDLSTQVKVAEASVKDEREIEANLQKKIKSLEQTIAQNLQDQGEWDLISSAMKEQIDELSKYRESAEQLSKREAELQARVDLLDQDLNDAETEIEELSEKFKHVSRELAVKTKAESELRGRVEEVETAYESIVKSLKGTSAEGVGKMENEIRDLKGQLAEAARAIRGLAVELADADEAASAMKNLLAAAETDLERLVRDLGDSDNQKRKLEEMLGAAEADKSKLRKQIASIQNADFNSPVEDTLRANLAAVRAEADQFKSDFESLQKRLSVISERDQAIAQLQESLTVKDEEIKALADQMRILEEENLAASKLREVIDFKEREVAILKDELAHKQKDIDVVSECVLTLRDEQMALQKQLIERGNELNALRAQSVASIDDQLVASLERKLEDQLETESLLKRKLESVSQQLDITERLRAEAVSGRDLIQGRLDSATKAQQTLRTELDKAVRAQESLESQLEDAADLREQLKHDLEKSEKLCASLKSQLAESENARMSLEQQLDSASSDKYLLQELEGLRKDQEILQKQLGEAQQAGETLRIELERSRGAERTLKAELAELIEEQRQTNSWEEETMELREEIQRTDMRIASLIRENEMLKLNFARKNEDESLEMSELRKTLENCESELSAIRARRSARVLAPQVGKFEVLALSTHGEEQLVAVLQSSLRKAEDDIARGNEEIRKLVDEKAVLISRLTRLDQLIEGKQRGKVIPPAIVLQPLSDLVAVDDSGCVIRYVGANKDGDMCGCAITQSPLPLFEEGVYFEVRVTQTQVGNPDGLTVGLTTTPPWQGEPVPNTLDDIPNSWAVGYNGQCWNGAKGEWKQVNWSGQDLVEGQRVGVFLATPPVSQLFVFVDDVLVFRGPTRLPSCIDYPFYGLVDLLGNCDAVTLLWGAKPPSAVQDLVALEPTKLNPAQFRLPARRGIQSVVSEESSIVEETSPMRKVAVPRLPLKPTVEPSGPPRPLSESDSDTFRR